MNQSDDLLSYFNLNKLDIRLGNEVNRCLDINDKLIINIILFEINVCLF